MAQSLTQTQENKQLIVQRISQQQMLQVRLLEMPITELEDNVRAELDDNPALEVASNDPSDYTENTDPSDSTDSSDSSEGNDFLDDALSALEGDDYMPRASYDDGGRDNAEYEERVYGDTTSFYDKLRDQAALTDLKGQESEAMDYIIGSLDDDGLLRKDNDTLADELAIYHNIDLTPEAIGRIVGQLQAFEPAGIGAHTLQECLLLQIARRPKSRTRDLMHEVVERHFSLFIKKRWAQIAAELHIDAPAASHIEAELRKLNPKPGAAMGETEGRNLQQVTPDFIVETQDDGRITFTLNAGDLPQLRVSPSFTQLVDTYRRGGKATMSRSDKEALLYAKEKVDKAMGYIEAIRQRRLTLTKTMQAIIDWQRKFFLDGDEADLRPMKLENIAERTSLNIATISRVSNSKYAQTNWGTFPLRFFFTDKYTTKDGKEISTRRIKMVLREIVDAEDKTQPLSDDALTAALAAKGFPVARRTVAKYREQLGLPVARLRRND